MKPLTVALGAFAIAVLAIAPVSDALPTPTPSDVAVQFDHAKHEAFGCTTCPTNVQEGQVYPDPSFCSTCHNGTVAPSIDWSPPTPASRANLKFSHATHFGTDQCANCHVQNDVVQRVVISQCMACHGVTEHPQGDPATCNTCHIQVPAPQTHAFGWRDGHASPAASNPETCATCHVRVDCLDCHRSGAASPAGGYHPADFLSSHSVAAYSQEMTCADCHNPGAFCRDCHQGAGLVVGGPTSGFFHDGTGGFAVGHGQAARQSLESCVACHSERDCVRCHVNVSPHGPGFDADEQADAARSACVVCHGRNVPEGND